eukprot:TRINITY_DN14939_c0_g1_i3.p1 TRINITY_DN14939_c0_g1~~TRINITY_DN14939_c0_g1_i3.p1  ORF type:complete len:160 (+),score=52.72 TRINITY_DN14939_c0_g1_i3:48-527(+)
MVSVNTISTVTMDNIHTIASLARRTTKMLKATTLKTTTARLLTTTLSTTSTTSTSTTTLPPTAAPHTDPASHVFLTLGLIILTGILIVGFAAVGLVVKTRWDRYRLHMMPLYQFDQDQEDLEAELLDSPEREPVTSSKTRRDFGTCQNEDSKQQLNLLQ